MCVWVLAPTAVALVPVAVCVGGCDVLMFVVVVKVMLLIVVLVVVGFEEVSVYQPAGSGAPRRYVATYVISCNLFNSN